MYVLLHQYNWCHALTVNSFYPTEPFCVWMEPLAMSDLKHKIEPLLDLRLALHEQHSMVVVACQWDIVYILSSLTMVDNKGLTFRQYFGSFVFLLLYWHYHNISNIYRTNLSFMYWKAFLIQYTINIDLHKCAYSLLFSSIYLTHVFPSVMGVCDLIFLWFRFGLDLFQLDLSCLCGFN